MSATDFVSEALAPLATLRERDGIITVPTHCLYPSHAVVNVYVRGGANGAVVSDEGRAIDELTSHNRDIANPDRFLQKFCRRAGLNAKNGKIVSPPVEPHQLAASVMFVANASASAVSWGLEHLKVRRRRDLRRELEDLLERTFSKAAITPARLSGKSTRQYKFENAIHIGDRLIIVDPVLPDANSINSHAIAHMDIRQLGDERIVQRLVYDDEDEWGAAELNLLRMAAPLVPFSKAATGLERLVRHDA
jgi:hypothetical protein